MEELGIGLVNQQAAELTELSYPEWVGLLAWHVVGKVGTDEKGYDLYELRRGPDTLTVPSNRLVLMSALIERMANGRL